MVGVYCYLCATVLLLKESWDQVMMGHECVVFKYADLGESAITRYNPKDRLTFSGSSPLPNLGVCSSAHCPAQLGVLLLLVLPLVGHFTGGEAINLALPA